MADDLALVHPLGIDAHAWTAVAGHRDRLDEARRGGDRSLVLGRAKELAESVARVVITERGQVAPPLVTLRFRFRVLTASRAVGRCNDTAVGTRLTKPAVPGAPTAKNASPHSVPGLSFTRLSQKGTP
jgi:hypothetical protein